MKPRQCGFVTPLSEMSDNDRKIIEQFKKDLANRPEPQHKHVWSNWLPSKNPGEEFRICIDCGTKETRYADHKR